MRYRDADGIIIPRSGESIVSLLRRLKRSATPTLIEVWRRDAFPNRSDRRKAKARRAAKRLAKAAALPEDLVTRE